MSSLREKIAVMQAFEDGKPIQYKPLVGRMEWTDIAGSPVWDWPHTEYRIKPGLREWWILDDPVIATASRNKAYVETLSRATKIAMVHVVEKED